MALKIAFNSDELAALVGLPHLTQLVYLQGIRPNMDFVTGVAGIKTLKTKAISYQMLSELTFVEPGTGRVSSGSPSKKQLRGCVSQLVECGVVESLSTSGTGNNQLILKCVLADADESVLNNQGTDWAQHEGTQQVTPETVAKVNNNAGLDVAKDSNQGTEQGTPKPAYQGTQPEPLPTKKHNNVRERNGFTIIPDGFVIDSVVEARLMMAGVTRGLADFFLQEFVAANESSGFASKNWPSELVKYCKRFEWRYVKHKEQLVLKPVGPIVGGDVLDGFETMGNYDDKQM